MPYFYDNSPVNQRAKDLYGDKVVGGSNSLITGGFSLAGAGVPLVSMNGPLGRQKLYYLSYDINGTNKKYHLLPFVTDIGSEKTCATVFQWTLGPRPIRWHGGRREEIFTINGKGSAVFLNHPMASNLETTAANGLVQLEGLVEYIAEYEEKGSYKNVRMTLHMPFENKAYYVEPVHFTWQRGLSAGTKFGYVYSLTVRAWKYNAPTARLTFTPEEANESLLESVEAGLLAVQNTVLEAGEFRLWAHGFVDRYARMASGAVGLLPAIASQAASILEATGNGIEYFQSFAGQLLIASNTVTNAWSDLLNETPVYALDEDPAAKEAMDHFYKFYYGKMGDIFDSACLAIAGGCLGKDGWKNVEKYEPWNVKKGFKSGDATGYVGKGNFDFENIPTTDYTVKIGDSLEKIAFETTGNTADWKLIARLNKMIDPGFYDKKPLTPGMIINVPDFFRFTFQDSTDSDPYFTDMLLDAEGDLVIKGDNTDDIKTVSHHLCLKQDLLHRLLTIQGQSLIFPENGLPFGAGEAGTGAAVALLTDEVSTQIGSDPRISSMDQTTLVDRGASVTIESKAVAVDGKVLSVVIPV